MSNQNTNRLKMYTKMAQYLPGVAKHSNNYLYEDYWQNNNSNQIYETM